MPSRSRAVVDLRRLVDDLGNVEPVGARRAIAALEWDTRRPPGELLVLLPYAFRAYPGRFLHDLADATRDFPWVFFNGHAETVRRWDAGYQSIVAGHVFLALTYFVDDATGLLDDDQAVRFIRDTKTRRRLSEGTTADVDLPEWRTLEPSPRVLDALAQVVATVIKDRAAAPKPKPLDVRFFGNSAHAWTLAYRSAQTRARQGSA